MATYRPDHAVEWFAAVRGRVVLMTPARAAAELTALWPELTTDDPTSRVLDRLTTEGLAATPPFALVVREPDADSARIVVRGPLEVHAGGTTLSGAGIATWTERLIGSGDVRIEVTDDAGDSTAGAGPAELPVVEAIVPARAVTSQAAESVKAEPPVPAELPAAAKPPVAAESPIERMPLAASVPMMATTSAPPAEQTIVPVEETIAGPPTSAQPTPAHTAPTSSLEGDHDGLTVASIDLRRLRAERAARLVDQTPSDGVSAVTATIAAAPRSSLRMPDGSLEPIAHEVVLGRAPSVSQVSGGRLPRLITIGAGDPDISRNHLRVAIEGGTVVITDLHSRNGTHVVAPGKPPVKLRAGEPTPVLAGTVVDLGGGCTLQVVGA
jgi:hypothetical protein